MWMAYVDGLDFIPTRFLFYIPSPIPARYVLPLHPPLFSALIFPTLVLTPSFNFYANRFV